MHKSEYPSVKRRISAQSPGGFRTGVPPDAGAPSVQTGTGQVAFTKGTDPETAAVPAVVGIP